MCHEKFESRSQRMEHIASHHKDVKLFDCDICEFKSMTKKSLREHVYGTHEHANICSLCGKNFATRCSLNNHMRYVHSGKKKSRANCTLCDASFSQPITLRHHMEQASFSSYQRNLIKTFQIEAMIALITKMALIFS